MKISYRSLLLIIVLSLFRFNSKRGAIRPATHAGDCRQPHRMGRRRIARGL